MRADLTSSGGPQALRLPWVLVPVVVLAVLLVALTGVGAGATGAVLERAGGPVDTDRSVVVRDLGDAVVSVRLPAGEGPHPVVVHVPGGGWTEVDPTPVGAAFGHDEALADGWAVATVAYEPAGGPDGTTAADQAEAVTEVLAWLRDDGASIGLGGPVVGVGHSAGAHLLALATAPTDRRVQPDVLVLAAGVYDLADDVRAAPMLTDGLRAAAGCGPDACTGADRFAPAAWADPADPPTIVVHGTHDVVTPAGGSSRYADALHEAGVPAILRLVDGARHHDDGLAAAVAAALREARRQVGETSSRR